MTKLVENQEVALPVGHEIRGPKVESSVQDQDLFSS